MQSEGFGGWGLLQEFMASFILLKSELDTKCLGLFSSPVVIKCACELQLLRRYFIPSSSAPQMKAKLSCKQNPSCAVTRLLNGSSLTAASRNRGGHYLTGGIYCFVALKVKGMLMENGFSSSRETPAFD